MGTIGFKRVSEKTVNQHKDFAIFVKWVLFCFTWVLFGLSGFRKTHLNNIRISLFLKRVLFLFKWVLFVLGGLPKTHLNNIRNPPHFF